MSYSIYLFLTIVCFDLYLDSIETKYVEGTLDINEPWSFISRFCFISDVGELEYYFEYPLDYQVQNLLLYFDTETQWPAVYKTPLTCEQKEHVLVSEHNQMINLTTINPYSGCNINTMQATEPKYVCRGKRSFRSRRERWWFIAISNCNTTKGLKLLYKLTMTNGERENFWDHHFSADEIDILPTNIAFFLIAIIMMTCASGMGYILSSRLLLHTTFKMFLFSLAFHCFSLLLLCIAYGVYARNGVGSENTKLFAYIIKSMAEIVFLFMLILMAKGYTITRGRLRHETTTKLAVLLTLCIICYAVVFIIKSLYFDPGKVLYLYESLGGYGLIAVRLLSWTWFCYAVFFTIKQFPEKSNFYYPFFFIYSIWFVATPIMILIATHIIAKWVREKVVNGVENAVAFFGYCFFMMLTRPSRANINFPYHVRTTQIGVLDAMVPGHMVHTYAPSTQTPNFTELFVASNYPHNISQSVISNPIQHPIDQQTYVKDNWGQFYPATAPDSGQDIPMTVPRSVPISVIS